MTKRSPASPLMTSHDAPGDTLVELPAEHAGMVHDGPLGAAPAAVAVGRTLARMVLSLEDHAVTTQSRHERGRSQLELAYILDGNKATWHVSPEHDALVTGGDGASFLPSPLANDVLVVLGEEINSRARGRHWDADSAAARTVSFSVRELWARMGQPAPAATSYAVLLETARRLAKLRIVARGGAWRGRQGRVRTEVIFGLVDRLEIISSADAPSGARLSFTLSEAFARGLSDDFRLLETNLYWRLPGDVPRRLYRLLDSAAHYAARRRTGRSELEATLRVPVHFLRDRLPLQESKTAHILRLLDRAHGALLAAGYLRAMPTYEPTTPDDLRTFPTWPGRTAKLVSAVYQIASPQGDSLRTTLPPRVEPALSPNGRRRTTLTLADRMDELLVRIPEASAHIGLCTAALKAIPDDEAFFVVLATAMQEHGDLPRVSKFVVATRELLMLRGLAVPDALLGLAQR